MKMPAIEFVAVGSTVAAVDSASAVAGTYPAVVAPVFAGITAVVGAEVAVVEVVR